MRQPVLALLAASALLLAVPVLPTTPAAAADPLTCVTTAPTGMAEATAGAVLPDGSALLAASDDGWAPTRVDVARVLPDGRADFHFGTDGIARLPLAEDSNPQVVAVLPHLDGVLVVVQVHDVQVLVVRLTSAGEVDPSWSTADLPGVTSAIAADVDAHDRLLILASTSTDTGTRSAVARVTQGGRLDPSYGEGGVRDVSLRVNVLGVVGDDAVLGAVTPFEVTYSRYLRVDATGQLDSQWGSGGDLVVQQSRTDGPPTGTPDRVLLPLVRDDVSILLAVGPDGTVDETYGASGSAELPTWAQLLDVREDGGLVAIGSDSQWFALDAAGALETSGVPSGVPATASPLDVGADGTGGRVLVADGSSAVVGRFRLPCDDPGEPPVGGTGVRRLAGTDRYSTAAVVSRDAFPDGAATAFVGTGGQFPDALSGGPAAATAQGPLLLTARDSLPTATTQELERLRPSRIVILGGSSAVSEAVRARLAALAPEVRRLSGDNRYATAAAISAATFAPGLPVVYLATGSNFPDALAGGALAGAARAPILLTGTTSLPAVTVTELRRLRPERVTVLGGGAAVSDQVRTQVERDLGVPVDRLAGGDRYETSARIADAVDLVRGDGPFGELRPAPDAFLVTGLNFPDALAAGPAAAHLEAAVLLASKEQVTEPVRANLAFTGAQRVTLLGGTSVLSSALEQRLQQPGYYGYTNYYDGGRLLRWNPCEPIRWRYNPAGEATSALPDLQEAMRRISAASGLSFVYEGLVDEPLPRVRSYEYQPERYGDRWAPVLIGWDDFDGGDLNGLGGFVNTNPEGVIVSGSLALNPRLAGPAGFGEGGLGRLVLHELGHVVGLGHVRHLSEIMLPAGDLRADLGAGDKAGLQKVGRPAGCLVTPEARAPGWQ